MSERTGRRRLLWLVVAICVSGYLLWLLGRRCDLDALMSMIRRAPSWSLLTALALYLTLGLWRALRFRVLLEQGSLSLAVLYPIVLLHNLLVRTFPFWTGEISYVTLTRHYLDVPVGQSVGTLVGARLFELMLVIVGGFTSALMVGEVLASDRSAVVMFGGGALVACLACIFLLGGLARRSGTLISRVAGQRARPGLPELIAEKLGVAADSLDSLRKPRVFAGSLFFSLCTYATSIAFNLLLLHAAGIDSGVAVLIAVISVAVLASAIPLSVSGLGVVEGGWTYGLVALASLDPDRAVVVAFFLHGCQLLAALLTGAAGYIWLQGLRIARGRAKS
jgi:uncharacterized protein (TIRG00374 family)